MHQGAEKRHFRARQQDPLAQQFRTQCAVPHCPLKLLLGRTFQHAPVKIEVHPALCQIPTVTPERGTVKQRLPGHAVLRSPPVVGQEATRLPQSVERHEDIHIPHGPAHPGIEAHAGGKSLDDERRHLPAHASQRGQDIPRTQCVLGECGPRLSTQFLRQRQVRRDLAKVKMNRRQQASFSLGRGFNRYVRVPGPPACSGDLRVRMKGRLQQPYLMQS